MSFRRSVKLNRLVSITIIAALLMPLLAVLPAAAQMGPAPMQVAVVEFRNDSGVQGQLLSRYATDAVVIEMSKSTRFDVSTRSQVEAQLKELGLGLPLSGVEISRLGEALGVESVVEGAIKAVEVRGNEANRRAAVTIVIRMVDQASGEVINGAIQTGYSTVRLGGVSDDDKLISEAINNAAYLAVKTMIDYIIPEATVLATVRSNEVLLNKGERDGFRNGMRLVVTRDREIIGRLQINSTQPDTSIATIVKSARGIKSEDKVKAVFDMPTLPTIKADPTTPSGVPASGHRASKIKGVGRVLLPLVALALLGSMFTNKGESVGTVVAEAGLSGYSLPVASGAPGVRIKWDRSKLSHGLNVVEYHIWRDSLPSPVLVCNPTDGEAFDDTNAREIEYAVVDRTTKEMDTADFEVPALDLGRPHRYSVSAVYKVVPPPTSEGGGDNAAAAAGDDSYYYYETQKSFTGQATPIAQQTTASLRLPAAGSAQNLHDVTFEWLSVRGVDTYVIEFSTDPSFQTIDWRTNPISYSPSLDGQPIRNQVLDKLYNLYQGTNSKHISTDTAIWWRVGARMSTDSPGPVPAGGNKTMRYIYSESSRFYPVEMPPDVPNP